MTMPAPGERTTALIRPFGANVLQVHAWPDAHITDVSVALRKLSHDASPVGIDDEGVPNALLMYSPTDYTSDDIAGIVEQLNETGIHTYGYELVHDHDVLDVDLFRRLGPIPAQQIEERTSELVADPLFILALVMDAENERGRIDLFSGPHELARVTGLFDAEQRERTSVMGNGADPASLAALEAIAEVEAPLADSCDPVYGPYGIDSVSFTFGYDFVHRAELLALALSDHGFDVHFRAQRARS